MRDASARTTSLEPRELTTNPNLHPTPHALHTICLLKRRHGDGRTSRPLVNIHPVFRNHGSPPHHRHLSAAVSPWPQRALHIQRTSPKRGARQTDLRHYTTRTAEVRADGQSEITSRGLERKVVPSLHQST